VQVPETTAFSTKPQIACDLIAAALDTSVPCAWVLVDALYGSDSRLRRMLEARGQAYVLAVRSNQTLRMLTADGFLQTDPAEMADELPAGAWTPHAAGEGSKGVRLYALWDSLLRKMSSGADPAQSLFQRKIVAGAAIHERTPIASVQIALGWNPLGNDERVLSKLDVPVGDAVARLL
jgi:hypothetical protein